MKSLEEALGGAILSLGNIAAGATIVGFIFEKKTTFLESLSVLGFAVICYVIAIVVPKTGGKQ